MYTSKLDNLDEKSKGLERQKLPELTQEEIESPNRPITSKETKGVMNKTQEQKHRNRQLHW